MCVFDVRHRDETLRTRDLDASVRQRHLPLVELADERLRLDLRHVAYRGELPKQRCGVIGAARRE
jgi:hypothetical protein